MSHLSVSFQSSSKLHPCAFNVRARLANLYRGSAHFLRLIVQLFNLLSFDSFLCFVYLFFFPWDFLSIQSVCNVLRELGVDLVVVLKVARGRSWRRQVILVQAQVEILDSFFRWTRRGSDRFLQTPCRDSREVFLLPVSIELIAIARRAEPCCWTRWTELVPLVTRDWTKSCSALEWKAICNFADLGFASSVG